MTETPAKTTARTSASWIRWFVDYSALVAFLIAFFVSGRDMTTATWALVAASAVALVIGVAVERRLAPVPLIAGGAALVFGGLALVFHDTRLLKIKPTVMNTLFAILLLGGLVLKKNPLKLILSDAFDLPEATWKRLTVNYALFFLFLAALNEIVWRTQADATWVLFRFPGLMILTFAFSLAHTPLLMKHLKTDKPPPPPTE
ncbi:inner membrane-spanning protein YciB [Phenylobacterium immobile]|uniref:inner membrane-spanning protein YciB n=1 Tax=Phenylobacterium immobile TaxID=21 RepID=UPI000B0EF560|nr:septation protein IspZ [Phenylobacterium immobile]